MKKVKILHVIGYLGCGGDTTAVNNVRKYIDLIGKKFQFDFVTHEGYNKDFVNQLEKEKCKIYVLDGDVRKIGAYKYFKEIRKILKENQYDAVHFHTSFQSAIGLLAAYSCGIKKRICHSHTTNVQRKISFFKKITYLPICRMLINVLSTKKIGCSKIANEFLFGKHVKSTIIYNGLDINNILNVKIDEKGIEKKYNFDKYTKIIGQVGRITDMKNPYFTIELAKQMKDYNCLFVMLGTGNLFDEIKVKIEEEKLKNVIMVGFTNDVYSYMKYFDYLILPSKYGEGLPVVLIEEQIVNEQCICIANNTVSEESNLGNVRFIDINDIDKWVSLIKESSPKVNKINYDRFDINNTAEDWLAVYK